MRDRPDHVWSGHEHVARALHHDGEVGDRRRVHGAPCAWTHDGRDLRNHTRRERVAQEDVRVSAERQHTFLNARAAGVVQADDGCSHLHSEVHDLDDLGRVGFGERSAEDGEVLREGVDEAAIDAAVSGDDAVAGNDLIGHAEIAATVRDERVGFFEAVGIEQEGDAFAGRQLARLAVSAKAILASAGFGLAAHVRQPPQRIRFVRRHTLAAWAFSQSFRNRSSPMSVSGCLKHCSITAAGTVTTSAPMRAASTTWIG